MISIKYLKEKSKELKSELQAVYYAFLHPEVGILPKLIIALALGYALSPIDLIPDFIPVIGFIDDLIIVPFLLTLSIKMTPRKIMQECRQKAKEEPVSLKKNWLTAILFIGTWIFLIYIVVRTILKLFLK